jgi:hypothetical protein
VKADKGRFFGYSMPIPSAIFSPANCYYYYTYDSYIFLAQLDG